MRRMARMLGIGILAIGLLLALRMLVAPAEGTPPEIDRSPDEFLSSEDIRTAVIPVSELARAVGDKRVILVGEEHFKKETVHFFDSFLDELATRRLVILLELPAGLQPALDAYRDEGDLATLQRAWPDSALPYVKIVEHIKHMGDRVLHLGAIDQNRTEVVIRRAFLSDSRNATMASAIVAAYERFPEATIVFYGGSMHTLLAGRYRYDVANREPSGSRVLRAGVPRSSVVTIVLSGHGQFPLSSVWSDSGALPMGSRAKDVPFQYFLRAPVFGPTTAGEIFDWFVNLGPLTPI